ncbi:hypothetical protein BJP27_24590 (plasmid) [Pseudomonas oryzihabitans]|nr:hypothetical protein BJP27_23940 [Pseudomonas psychrotolerans]APQ14750.1 hypothetical protein BJP27_24590 [Pseudomonas psychrotolerans]
MADKGILVSAQAAQRETNAKHRAGVAQREQSGIILSPDDVAGAYDTSRVLLTTLGGKVRAITRDDLLAFQASARLLGKKFKGGITAKQVIDLSLPAPLQKAHREIHTATPFQYKGGRVKVQTNAGPGSQHRRHVVTVEFMNYEAAVASPAAASGIVKQMLIGPIKLDCDCEDWRYRLRFIATQGKYAAGPWFEHGYPKETNPLLMGVGCKHVLRVCQSIRSSPTFKSYATRMIEVGRQSVERRAVTTKVKDLKAFEKAHKGESHRQRAVKTSQQKRDQRAAQPSYQRQLQAARERRANSASKTAAKTPVSDAKFLANLRAMGFTDAQAQAALAATKSAT